eukprot:TRINITY_DN24_c0_g1_i1.p1 TRINITY_DN24_c0_g1~~TRINITY_DN24_c0_g1_i1.p1  ORF type:complete len:1146 (-),score=312.83 TRINITY_DN24_c0_g1_i1:153-3293(-)
MDNRGHPMIKALGAVAGDAECYEVFRPLFDKLIDVRHSGNTTVQHSQSSGRRSLTTQSAEPFPGYVVSSQVRVSRNVGGFRFPPAASREERCEVERLLVKALLSLDGSLKGEYFPLLGSQTYAPKPGGMSAQEEKALSDSGLLFYQPDSTMVLSSGVGRFWPHGRGVFINGTKSLAAWVNEEEHLRATSLRPDSDLQAAYKELAALLDGTVASLQRESGKGFARSDRLGYLNGSPGNVGTAMKACMVAKLPLLKAAVQKELAEWCKARGLVVRSAVDDTGIKLEGMLEVSNRDRVGITEEESVNIVVEGVAELIRAEKRMEQGMLAAEALVPQPTMVERSLTPVTDELDDDQEYPPELAWVHAGDHLTNMLSEAVVRTSDSQEKAEPLSVHEVQAQVGSTLQKAADDGSLVAALENEVNKDELEAIKQRVARVLFIASMDNSFENAVTEVVQEPFLLGTAEETAAATKIQALRRGKTERAALEKQKKEENAAALRIQAIQRGKQERRLVEKQKQEETAAATRIQAIQKGKKTRREVEKHKEEEKQRKEEAHAATRIQAIHKGKKTRKEVATKAAAGADASPEDLTALQGKLKVTLQAAESNGALQRALAEAHGAMTAAEEVEAQKEMLRNTLEASLETGLLEEVLGIPKEAEMSTADLRTSMALQLEAALNDGSLESALMETIGEMNAPAVDLEDARCRMARQLEAALNDGSLESALMETFGDMDAPAVDLEDARSRMARQLEAALEDGSLESVVKEEMDLESTRGRMARQLEAALDDGSLEAALAAHFQADGGKSSQLEDTRVRMARQLEAALENGSFEAALAATVKADGGKSSQLEDTRVRMARQLEAALENGSFEAALAATVKAPASTKPAIESKAPRAVQELPERDYIAEANLAVALRKVPTPSDVAMKGAIALVKAIGESDRRMGKLTAEIMDAERRIMEKTSQRTTLEVELEKARSNLKSLDNEFQAYQRALHAEELREVQIKDSNRRLVDEYDNECLKHRHMSLEAEANLWATRSELSTAATLSELIPSPALTQALDDR